MKPLPWDFVGYILLAAVALSLGLSLARLSSWWKRRQRIALEREGRRDGYVRDGDEGRIDRWAS
jgi:hypothetical protein